jgi:hypothetical protein
MEQIAASERTDIVDNASEEGEGTAGIIALIFVVGALLTMVIA